MTILSSKTKNSIVNGATKPILHGILLKIPSKHSIVSPNMHLLLNNYFYYWIYLYLVPELSGNSA